MSVFEQLQPFVSLCQVCGLIPYTIKHSSTTGKFERFTFSVKHFTTWWFLLLVILQVSVVFIVGNLSSDLKDDLSADRNLPITMIILTGITSTAFLAQLLSSRWLALHYRQLNNAVEAVQKIEMLFGERFIAEHKSSVMTRFIVGFAVVVMAAIGGLFAMAPVYAVLLPENVAVFSITALFMIVTSINVMFDCSLLFVHMCCYIISHYIQLILFRCDKEDSDEFQATVRKGADHIKMMRRNALIFDYLCRASSEINSIFHLPAFYLLVVKFVTIVSTAFFCTYRFIYTNTLLNNASWIHPFLFITESIRVLFFLITSDMPVNQVRLLHERLTAMSLSGYSKTLAEKMTMMTLLIQIDEDRVQLSAAGVFKVGVHLIPAITGAAVTYMVILLQN